jgi:hypothetical protein
VSDKIGYRACDMLPIKIPLAMLCFLIISLIDWYLAPVPRVKIWTKYETGGHKLQTALAHACTVTTFATQFAVTSLQWTGARDQLMT